MFGRGCGSFVVCLFGFYVSIRVLQGFSRGLLQSSLSGLA